MSVQFGRWSFAGESPEREYMEKVSACIAPYGPDSGSSYSRSGIEIRYRGFHTTKEARREKQPHVCALGAVITWDGRLDNRDELIDELRPRVSLEDSDVTLVGTAFDTWGTECFAKLIGDWALSIWDARQRSLILAKDPIGPRHLYYSVEDEQITWCTVLDPLVLFAGKKFKLCEEYLAGWLSLYPATQLTPYAGIQAVSPATCVLLGPRKHIIAKYWDFDPDKRIRYRTDAEYEEHFRSVFFKAVQRRLRSDTPVLAELSGGRDSSSIVCVADEIIARGQAQTPRLDTISYYDDSEPNWNERPYFTLVEKKRGRMGWHIDISSPPARAASAQNDGRTHYGLTPALADNALTSEHLGMCLASQHSHVILSGTAGDEVMGGIPTPTPGLQDLIARARLRSLARQLKTWALQQRTPWFHLFLEAALGFFPLTVVGVPSKRRSADWFQSSFVSHHRDALTGYWRRIRLLGSLPSFQDSLVTLDSLRRQIACAPVRPHRCYEKRYPYLDIDLLQFMYAIPREQSVRPAQRRSLMRRALAGIVPAEILNRNRKASVARAPMLKLFECWNDLVGTAHNMMICNRLNIVDAEKFLGVLQKVREGEEMYSVSLDRAIQTEAWLQDLERSRIVDFDRRQMVDHAEGMSERLRVTENQSVS